MLSEQTVATFAARLEAYAVDLPEREREILGAILIRAMDPLERMGLQNPSSILGPHEEAVLRTLADKKSEG